jgi:hypothetical protein
LLPISLTINAANYSTIRQTYLQSNKLFSKLSFTYNFIVLLSPISRAHHHLFSLHVNRIVARRAVQLCSRKISPHTNLRRFLHAALLMNLQVIQLRILLCCYKPANLRVTQVRNRPESRNLDLHHCLLYSRRCNHHVSH